MALLEQASELEQELGMEPGSLLPPDDFTGVSKGGYANQTLLKQTAPHRKDVLLGMRSHGIMRMQACALPHNCTTMQTSLALVRSDMIGNSCWCECIPYVHG